MNFFSTASIIAFLLLLSVSLVSFLMRRTKSHLVLSWVMLLIGIWSLLPFILNTLSGLDIRLSFARFFYFIAASIPFAFLSLALSVLNGRVKTSDKTMSRLSIIFSVIFALLALNSNYIAGISDRGNSAFVVAGKFFPFFILYFLLVGGWTLWRIARELPKLQELKRNQFRYLWGGIACAYIGESIHLLAPYTRGEIFPHTLLICIFAAILSYSILRHNLFDFTLIMRWSVVYFILIVLLFAFVLPIVLSMEWGCRKYFHLAPGVTTLLIISFFILAFDPFKKRTTKFVDDIIFKSPDSFILSEIV